MRLQLISPYAVKIRSLIEGALTAAESARRPSVACICGLMKADTVGQVLRETLLHAELWPH